VSLRASASAAETVPDPGINFGPLYMRRNNVGDIAACIPDAGPEGGLVATALREKAVGRWPGIGWRRTDEPAPPSRLVRAGTRV
jgi:hypothetical protein